MLAAAWGKLSIAELRNGEERLSILLVFGIVYFFFFKPTCSLGPAGKQDIQGGGKGLVRAGLAHSFGGNLQTLLQGGRSCCQAPSWLSEAPD